MIRVLVAEDHTIVREGIKQLIGLAKDLVVVGEASNGEQLLETLRHVPCEVVLLDISMPGVNGLEAIPRIRALNNPPAILVLSMHDEAQMAARALKVGAAGYATRTVTRPCCSWRFARSRLADAISTRTWPTAWSLRSA